jgi:hypothetical protein
MTFERYTALNELANHLLAEGGNPAATSGLAGAINSLSDRERKVVNGMVFFCERCGRWQDRDNEHNNSNVCCQCARSPA